MTELTTIDNAKMMEQVVVGGDLSKMSPADRLNYYQAVCNSLGLNPLTKPFDYISLQGKLTLYARKDATEQLRRLNGISIAKLERETVSGVYVVTAYASAKDGRTDSSIGAVSIEGLKGDALANAMMKAETKAKRRVTLSIGGLGWLDETEVETIPGAMVGEVVVEQIEAEPQPQGWIYDEATRRKFWAATGGMGLTHSDVHKALAVKSMKEWAGSFEQAIAICEAATLESAVKDLWDEPGPDVGDGENMGANL